MRCDQEHGASKPNTPPWLAWILIPVFALGLFWLGATLVSGSESETAPAPAVEEPAAVTDFDFDDDGAGCEDPCEHVCDQACPAVCSTRSACDEVEVQTCAPGDEAR